MRIRIDEDACTGHGRCYAVAPDLFEPNDEDGFGQVIDERVPPEREAQARLAAGNCPERAVIIAE